jgi:hypothetical protein
MPVSGLRRITPNPSELALLRNFAVAKDTMTPRSLGGINCKQVGQRGVKTFA